MKGKIFLTCAVYFLIAMLCTFPRGAMAQSEGDATPKKLSKEELAQLLAPIALYPDELVTQILMASTYPLEIVQADRWAKSHKQVTGDDLAKQLEKESWDPSVKSLVNFPTVLSSMSEKLDVTTKIGDAFLAQQKDVMDTVQELRKRAYDAGNLKTTKEQKIIVEKETIVIQPANPEVIYVPAYSPTVVYGTWMYPSYPPYYYYPPPPPAYPPYYFAAGVAVGVAWGYAWGHADWHGGDVQINHNQNINVNRNIDRSKYQNKVNPNNRGSWQHDPSHRKNVAYRDGATAKQFGQSSSRSAEARGSSRGFGDGGAGGRPSAGTMDRGAGQRGSSGSAGAGRDSAFGGGSGRQERTASDRGMSSRQSAGGSSFSGGGSSRSGGGFSGGGGSRGGGGGGRGGRR
jgi:hypothetical protein